MNRLPVVLFLLPFVGAIFCALAAGVSTRLARGIAMLSMGATAVLSVQGLVHALRVGPMQTFMGDWGPPLPMGIEWVLDPLGALMALLVAWVAVITLLGSMGSIKSLMPRRETYFHCCALLLVSGLMGMIATGDLFNLFVHLEVTSLAAYALVASGGRGAPRAALNYLIIGSIGASLYLLGVGFLFAGTGSLNMAEVAQRLPDADRALTLTGSALMVTGLAVKMGLFPLHIWMPGAYSLAPPAASALMAPLVTKVSAYVLIRALFWVYQGDYLHQHPLLLELLCWAGAAAIMFGAAMAFAQADLWRLLAYSSVSQMGIVVLGIGLANASGLTGALLHIVNDALMKGALFLAAGFILWHTGVRRVDELCKMRGRSPWITPVFIVVGLSLVGIPPLAGFYGKWYVLVGAVEAHRWGMAGAIIIGSMFTIAYVFRIFEQLFFAKVGHAAQGPVRGGWSMMTASVVFTLAVAGLGVFNSPAVVSLIRPALPGEFPGAPQAPPVTNRETDGRYLRSDLLTAGHGIVD